MKLEDAKCSRSSKRRKNVFGLYTTNYTFYLICKTVTVGLQNVCRVVQKRKLVVTSSNTNLIVINLQ